MLLADYQNLTVFKVDNTHFEAIGQINQLKNITWGKYFSKYFDFQINVPASEENNTLLVKGNIIWGGGKEAGIIDIVEGLRNTNGELSLVIKGRTLECLLTRRIIAETMVYKSERISTILYDMVDKHFISTEEKRIMPWLECAEDEELGLIVTLQKTGGDVYSALNEICARDESIGFEVQFLPNDRKIRFVVLQAQDHSISSNSPVVFSNLSDDIITDSYYENVRDHKNVACVAGEAKQDGSRWLAYQGNTQSSGFERLEYYVDARDLQKTVDNVEMTDQEYIDTLKSRGAEKLGKLGEVLTFDGNIKIDGSQFVFGTDYNIGDIITVQDTEFGIQVDARVSCIQEKVSDNYEAKLTLGYELPTLSEKLSTKYS